MRPLEAGMLEAKRRLEEFGHCSYQNAEDALRQYNHVFRAESAVGAALRAVVPEPDFATWYDGAMATKGGMVGSARLTWPLDVPERVALQLELINRMADGDPPLLHFCHDFTHEGNRFDQNIHALWRRVLVPFHNDVVALLEPALAAEGADQVAEATGQPSATTKPIVEFIHPARLEELQAIQSDEFDLRKVVQLCREIDGCFRDGAFLCVAALTRALLDHVPPIFGCRKFSEVANNYGGSKSFKDAMQHLESSARKIGDSHLHTQIRRRESLPTSTQVNFSNDLDVLLAEMARILG